MPEGSVKYRVLFVNSGSREYRIEEFSTPEVLGPIDLGIKLHLEKYESWKYDVFSENNVVVIGKGLLTGGKLVGVHRLIAVFRSPETKSIHVSAMGGAAYKFMGAGIDAVVIEGKSEKPLIVFIEGDEEGNVKVEFKELSIEELRRIYDGYAGKKGVYALTKYLIDNYWDFISRNKARPIVVGPASIDTIEGGIFSLDIDLNKKDIALGAEDSASRGGGGSVLFRAHGVVALVVGGKFKPASKYPKLNDLELINKICSEVLGKPYMKAVVSSTTKYRYDEGLKTGGTFGVNYPHYKDLIPTFGYNMMYIARRTRVKLHELIMEYFWKPFNEEVFIKNKSWYTCGEPCPATCKKVWRGKKVDYEPFNGLGPIIGVFKFEDSVELVDLVDALGFDAIEIGHLISWLFDAMNKGLLKPEELGLSEKPYFDPLNYRIEYSSINAKLAKEIIEGLVKKENEILKLIAEKGAREAAKELDKKFADRVKELGTSFEDLLVYTPYGESGYMTPNYYWAPGMVAPLYILGRYWTNYTPTFMEPEDFAVSSFTRAIKEYDVDNAGLCRFHRKWAEKILERLYKELLGIDVNLDEHTKEMYRKIVEYAKRAKAEPVYWEGSKTKDVVITIANEVSAKEWSDKFASEPEGAIKEWWSRFRKKLDELIASK